MRYQKIKLLIFIIAFPAISQASFIETTMGAAVVNDATAAYYNPAALVVLKNSQIIPLGTIARFRTQFKGQSTTVATGFTEVGVSSSNSNYYSPSFYFGFPVNNRITAGFAMVSNFANRNPEENSLLRYIQSSNSIQDYDFVPSMGIKLNEYFSLGAGINFSQTNFNLHPISGFPGSNIADSQSTNESKGSGIGANAGFLFKPNATTLIGFNYRTVTTYREHGKSVFNGPIQVVSNNYHFIMRTPARTTLSISHFLSSQLGVISTVQRVQWGIIRNININGIATLAGFQPVIINTSVPQHLRDTWAFTLGSNYKFKPNWIVRLAGTYNQSPENGHYQVSTGDSYILGTSLGWEINKRITLNGSYAHAFLTNQKINTSGNRFRIIGNNQGSREVVSLKMTINV